MNGQKNLPAFGDLISTKSKLVPVSFSGPREYWYQIPKLSHSGGGYGFYPLFFFCSCHLSGKSFHETFLFIPNLNAPMKSHTSLHLFSSLSSSSCFPLLRALLSIGTYPLDVMSSYPVFKYFLSASKFLTFFSLNCQRSRHSFSLSLSAEANCIYFGRLSSSTCREDYYPYLKTNTLARSSAFFSFPRSSFLPMVWYINPNAKPVSDIPSFDVERAPSSSRLVSCTFAHRYYRSPSSHVHPFISRRSLMTPFVCNVYNLVSASCPTVPAES